MLIQFVIIAERKFKSQISFQFKQQKVSVHYEFLIDRISLEKRTQQITKTIEN